MAPNWHVPPLFHDDSSSPAEEDHIHGSSSIRFNSHIASSRPCTQYDSSPTDSSQPLADVVSFNSHKTKILHKDYVPESIPAKISWVDLGRHNHSDMYRPIIRAYQYPYSRETQESRGLAYSSSSPFIEHIDIASVWKGISLINAKTLFSIHEAFKASLELLLGNALQGLFQEFRLRIMSHPSNSSDYLDDIKIMRQLEFSQSQLYHTMYRMLLNRSEEQPIDKVNHDFVMLLPLYLTTCDYLMSINGDGNKDTAIEVCAHYEMPAFRTIPPRIAIEAAWIPDLLSFHHVREIYREGDELLIVPHYISNSVFASKASRRYIDYSLGSIYEWLKWDENKTGFRGKVPQYSELRGLANKKFGKIYEYYNDGHFMRAYRLHVEIKALLTEHFLPCFRHERTVRARLTLKILPWYSTINDHMADCDFGKSFGCHQTGELSSSTENVCNNELDRLRSSDSKKPVFSQIKSLKGKSQKKSNERHSVSNVKLAPPTKRRHESDDECTVTLSSTLHNDGMFGLDCKTERKDLSTGLDSMEAQSLGSTESLSELKHLLCFSPFSVSCRPLLKGNSEEKANTRNPSLSSNGSGVSISRSQSVQGSNHTDNTGKLTYSVDGLCHGDQDATVLYPHKKSSKRQKPRVEFVDTCPASTDIAIQPEASRSLQSSPSSPTSQLATPPQSDIAEHHPDSENGSSSSLEFVVENPEVDPRMRREQAILWKALSAKENRINARLSGTERREIYNAMKESAEEEEKRRNARTGINEILDDIFMVDESNLDEGENTLSSLGKSEISSIGESLGSVDG